MSREDKQKAWSLMDVNKDGHLNYLEFCAAFKVPRSVPSPLPPFTPFPSSIPPSPPLPLFGPLPPALNMHT